MYVGDKITEKNKNYLKKGDIIREDEREWRVFDREGRPGWFFAWQIYDVITAYAVSKEFANINMKEDYPYHQEFSYRDAGILPQSYNNHKSYYMGNVYDYQNRDEFKMGDDIRCIDTSDSEGRLTFGRNYKLLNYCPRIPCAECEIIDDDGRMARWKKERFVKYVEGGKLINFEYYKIKEEIANLKGWDKKADDILSKLLHNSDGSYGLVVFNFYDDSGAIAIYDTTREKSWSYNYTDGLVNFEFSSRDQCEKLEAFKRALFWLLAHSTIERERKIRKLERQKEGLGRDYHASLDSINIRIKDLKK